MLPNFPSTLYCPCQPCPTNTQNNHPIPCLCPLQLSLSSYQLLDATARGRALDRQLDGMVPPYGMPPSRSQTQPIHLPHQPTGIPPAVQPDAAATTVHVGGGDRGAGSDHRLNQGAFTVPFGMNTAKECILRHHHAGASHTLGSSFALQTEGRTFQSGFGVHGKPAAVPGWDLEGGAVPFNRNPEPPPPKKHATFTHGSDHQGGGLASLGA